MVTKVVMPRLSLTMKEGSVVQWFKKEGDTIAKGEPIVEVLSEKATIDVEAPAAGVLRKILVEQGIDVPVNATLAIIAAPDEEITETETEALLPEKEEKQVILASEAKAEVATGAEERVLASPAAKRLAREHGIGLAQVKGSGPEGRIVEEDVQNIIQKPTKSDLSPKVKEIMPLTGIKKTTSERVTLSFRTAPHSTIIMEVDMSNAAKLRSQKQFSFTELLVKAVATALKNHPLINSTLEDENIKIYEDINVGIAIATEHGLVVPIIRNADGKSLEQVALELRGLTEKAREGKLTKEDVTGGTFTITNLGMFGVDLFIPIINPPEAAILAVGRIADKPVAIAKEIAIKPVMTLSLAYDHRIIDGAPAAQFLQDVKKTLESFVS